MTAIEDLTSFEHVQQEKESLTDSADRTLITAELSAHCEDVK
jgi:hypothetical protein